MPITPDTKDWTWVLERACPECGFDASSTNRAAVGGLVRANAADWRARLTQNERATLTRRPADDIWSPLEYACHVRDVYRLYDWRIGRMQEEDGVAFDNWDQDETAVTDRYNEQDPTVVADDIDQAAHAIASRLDTLPPAHWTHRGRRSDGATFTIDSIARYMVHDPIHHLHDATVA